ncbi:hypothetical protein [Prauserella muralis]|uniref:Uncharacterized protein n=1 Tax=Prauserella muralis TaxID=588067 RepID=A0A2V4ACJ3_9PSEU|nr:hypothetical protein [Prauserella muralis]PXY16615.1 hypothetical protein BAY60_36100 [Prauserella muralis]TWE11136.1 hypothetical protein FHX69_7355 [Prauserella muralis]
MSALTTAYRLLVEDPKDVVHELRHGLVSARAAEERALAGLRQAAITLVRVDRSARGIESQAGFAEHAGVDRMTVRDWIDIPR